MSKKHKINIPVLLMHGSRDVVSYYKKSISLAEHSSYIDLKIWNGLFHDLHCEMNKNEIFEFLYNWIQTENSM